MLLPGDTVCLKCNGVIEMEAKHSAEECAAARVVYERRVVTPGRLFALALCPVCGKAVDEGVETSDGLAHTACLGLSGREETAEGGT